MLDQQVLLVFRKVMGQWAEGASKVHMVGWLAVGIEVGHVEIKSTSACSILKTSFAEHGWE